MTADTFTYKWKIDDGTYKSTGNSGTATSVSIDDIKAELNSQSKDLYIEHTITVQATCQHGKTATNSMNFTLSHPTITITIDDYDGGDEIKWTTTVG